MQKHEISCLRCFPRAKLHPLPKGLRPVCGVISIGEVLLFAFIFESVMHFGLQKTTVMNCLQILFCLSQFFLHAELFARGHNLHACIQKQLETGDGITDLVEKNVPYWESIEKLFRDFTEIQYIEKYCRHPHLRYHGYFDCIAHFRFVSSFPCVRWSRSCEAQHNL